MINTSHIREARNRWWSTTHSTVTQRARKVEELDPSRLLKEGEALYGATGELLDEIERLENELRIEKACHSEHHVLDR